MDCSKPSDLTFFWMIRNWWMMMVTNDGVLVEKAVLVTGNLLKNRTGKYLDFRVVYQYIKVNASIKKILFNMPHLDNNNLYFIYVGAAPVIGHNAHICYYKGKLIALLLQYQMGIQLMCNQLVQIISPNTVVYVTRKLKGNNAYWQHFLLFH